VNESSSVHSANLVNISATISEIYNYRAMHFGAKRGIAIACRLSVRLSVCDVGEL